MLAPVFFTNLKSGLVFLNVLVCESSFSNDLSVLTSLSSVPWVETTRIDFGTFRSSTVGVVVEVVVGVFVT